MELSELPIYKKYESLFEAAVKADQYGLITKKYKVDPSNYSNQKQLKKAIKEKTTELAVNLQDKYTDPEDVPDAISDLMSFVDGLKVASQPEECKLPLSESDTSFNDIAGQEDVKNQLRTSYIYPFSFPMLFPSISKGILFYGPPGTGKTLLARAATAEIKGAVFYNPTPGELRGRYEGDTEKNISQVFDCAENYVDENDSANFAIIFIDEFESLGGERGDDPGMTRSVNAFLQAMDGIKEVRNISVLAATNLPWKLDSAIIRRFATKIFVDLPDEDAREYLIRRTLAMSYSDPDKLQELKRRMSSEEKREKRETLVNSDNFLDNIAEYGGYEKKELGIISSRIVDTYVTESTISKFVKNLGPKQEGQEIIDEVNEGKAVSLDDARMNTPHIFGYSPSDITKVLDIAIRAAAARALQGYARRIERWGDIYYVHDYQLTEEDVDNRVVFDIFQLDPTERKRVLNFDIRESDIEQATKSYSSSIENQEYLELLRYARSN